MRKIHSLLPFLSVCLALLAGANARAQSAYYQAVTNLNPVLYLPLQETVQPPANDVETNLGGLGPVANAVYSSIHATKGFTPAATADGDTAVMFTTASGAAGDGGFLAVPTTDSRYAVAAPFSVEAWVYPTNYNGFVGIVSQSGGNPGGLNGGGVQGGWCLSAQYITYFDTSSNFRGFDFHVYNGHSPASGGGGPRGGAEVAVPLTYSLNTWYHLVATFDGTNCALYVNGTNLTSTAIFLVPMPPGTTYVRDTWDPLEIGASRNLNGNRYGGAIDEVAVYTNLLTQPQVQNHFDAAANTAPGSYQTAVMLDQPFMYYRMNAPAYTAPSMTAYPAAPYYTANGTTVSVGAGTLTTPVYGTATTPGVTGPQFPGLVDPGLGNKSYSVAINGLGGANGGTANVNIGGTSPGVSIAEAVPVDVGYSAALNPLVPPFSISIWFKGNPADENGGQRFQEICGHTDNGWRAAVDTAGKVHFKPGNNGTEITSARVYNDGNWHHLVATCSSTTENVYVDGVLDSTATSAASFAGSLNDVLIGGDAQYLNSGNGTYASNPSSSGTYAQRYFAGSVAHFAFFNYELSPANVSALYAVVDAPPVIMGQPFGPRTNGYAYNGTNTYMFFGVTASGSAPLAYQWCRTNNSGLLKLADDGLKYASSTTAQVTVSNLVDSDSGTYFVVVTNNYGAVTSAIGTTAGLLQVYQEPVILGQTPAGGTLQFVAGQTPPSFSVSVTAATNALAYQWYTNGGAIPGATGLTLPLPPVQVANSGVVVQFIAANAYGSATSASITLSVSAAPAPPTNGYAQAMLALGPSGYWPMHEVEPPLAQRNIETNYGSAGRLADAYYCDWQFLAAGVPGIIDHQAAGALANDADTSVYFSGQVSPANFPAGGSGAVIPRTSPLTTIRAPFTLEAWVRPADAASFQHILSVGSLVAGSGINGGANEGGFDWLYSGSANTFSITVRNGNGTSSTEPKTSANYPPGQWYHLVTTFDGTNVNYYINGNTDTPSSPGATMNPNTWMPLTIAGGRWSGAMNNPFRGSIDELAVYTNLLQYSDIQAHYTAGTSGAAGAYKTAVLGNNPLLYYRMDSPAYTQPPISTWPLLTNYGSAGVQGTYRPNAVPGGVSGPGTPTGVAALGFPNTALASDGMSVFADAGYDPSFNPANPTNAPFSVSAWFKMNPADVQQRNWQTLVGHTDQGWRCAANGGTGAVGFDSGNGKDVRSAGTYNDGIWHQVVGVYDGASNTLVYVDGALAGTGSATAANQIQTAYDVYLASSPNGQSNAFGGRTFAGNMCEAAVWNTTALSSNQVYTLYNAAGFPPYISTQPISSSANQNSSFTNTVVAGGGKPLAYQWYKNNLPLPFAGQNNLIGGATNASLIISPVLLSDQSTNYYVVITNSFGSVTSVVWALNPVFSTPVFVVEPAQLTHTNSIKLFAGAHPTFKSLASGAQPLSYQWFTNRVAATANATTSSNYTFLPLPLVGGVTNVYCVASNFVGRTTNTAINITALPAPFYYGASVLAAGPISYWRLNEPEQGGGDAGVIADDYWGGNNGVYTNATLGLAGYGPCLDPLTTAAQFQNTAPNSMAFGIGGIDFSATNTSVAFSIEAWANGGTQSGDAAIVSKGYGGGGEQFCLDVHGGFFRFFVRNAAGTAPNATSAIGPDNLWHHLVGVCDETHGYVALYVDGLLRARTAIATGSGINALGATNLMTIGSRPSTGDTTLNDLEFNGYINDVAVYNYALNGAQVAAQYLSSGIPPIITQDVPPSITVNENGTLIISAAATGTAPLFYQWYDATTSAAVPNQTNATLVISNFPSALSGESYYLSVTNVCGSTVTATIGVGIFAGPPQFVVDLPAQVAGVTGSSYTYVPVVNGTEPFSYRWYNGTTPIVGQTGPTYSLVVTPGNYSVVVSNSTGISVTSVVSVMTVVPPLSSAYASAVQSLGAVGYWPLNETNQPPVADLETNLGSFGAAGNAFYVNNAGVVKGVPGALAGDPDTAITLNSGNGCWLGVPRRDPGLTLSNAFTVECWVKPADTGFAALISQATQIGSTTVGYRGDANVNGWALYQNGGAPGNFSFHLYNGVTGGGPEPKEFAIYDTTAYQHVVAVFDGVNVILYVNGLQSVTSVPLSSANPAVYAPNYWSPVEIGASGINNYRFNGSIDEVAIYNYALTSGRIEAHYEAGTNAAVNNYSQVVQTDLPYLYYRLDSPTYTAPSTATYPLAVNYGSFGAALDGIYQPATVPGVSGPPTVSMGNNHSVAVNGLNSSVVIPYNTVLDPIGYTPFSVTAWFRGNPADGNGRWENVLGHSDRSWVFHFNNTVPNFDVGFSGGNTDVNIATNLVNANDGNWHYFAGTYDGTAYTVYVDTFVNSAIASATGIPGTNLDILIGGDPQFTDFGDLGGFNERYWPGNVAQVAFFTNALTALQVQQLYTVGTNRLPTLSIARSGANVVLTWNGGTLLSATNVTGPYAPVTGATPPYTTAPSPADRFFRTRFP